MKTREEALEYGLTFPRTYVDAPFHDRNWQLVRVKPSEKAFLWTYERNGYINLNVKVDPEWRDFWRDAFAAVIPGWHQNKEHWNTIKRIYDAVCNIPKGKVATYGQVAALAGNPKMSRAVGNALHKNPDPDRIPCYRVVNSKGELSGAFAFGGKNVQAERLMADGIEVVGGRVDLKKYGI